MIKFVMSQTNRTILFSFKVSNYLLQFEFFFITASLSRLLRGKRRYTTPIRVFGSMLSVLMCHKMSGRVEAINSTNHLMNSTKCQGCIKYEDRRERDREKERERDRFLMV